MHRYHSVSQTATKSSSLDSATPLAKPRPSSATEASPARGSYRRRRPPGRASRKPRNQLWK
uniref:Uncharacterized protein n=1 Tax=Arundo donax TaxID=35708 RepID=A0A0A9H9B7_ARUDO